MLALAGTLCLLPGLAMARGGAVLFEHSGYGGRHLRIDGAVPNLSAMGFNDIASSIRVRDGSWLLCQDSDFHGRCVVVDGDVENFGQFGLNDRVTSIRPLMSGDRGYGAGHDERHWGDHDGRGGDAGRGRETVILFQNDRFSGQSIVVDKDVSDLGRMGFNDRLTSLRVDGGVWLLCEHANYQGRCVKVQRDIPNLSSLGLNDAVSSIRRVR